jgi:hypothetical protein
MSVRDYNLDSNRPERLNKSVRNLSTSNRNLKIGKDSTGTHSREVSKKQITFSSRANEMPKKISENFFKQFQAQKFKGNTSRSKKSDSSGNSPKRQEALNNSKTEDNLLVISIGSSKELKVQNGIDRTMTFTNM